MNTIVYPKKTHMGENKTMFSLEKFLFSARDTPIHPIHLQGQIDHQKKLVKHSPTQS